MESRLPKITEKFYQRKQVVMIASEYADIMIADFPYQVWIGGVSVFIDVFYGYFHQKDFIMRNLTPNSAFNLQDISKYLWREVEMCIN